jgi:capsular exopolysaccharide synthesis family protein
MEYHEPAPSLNLRAVSCTLRHVSASSLPSTLPAQAATDHSIDLRKIWRSVRKYWATALIVATVVELLVAFWTLSRMRVYRAEATVEFDPNPPRPLGKSVDTVVEMGAGGFWDNREYYETQYKILQSMHVALATVQSLGLDHDPAFLQMTPPGGVPRAAQTTPTTDEAAEILRGRLTVAPVRDSRLVQVSLDDSDPQRAQRILTVLVNTYVEQNMDATLDSTSAATDWLRGQLDTLKTDLETSEMALHSFKQERNILSVDLDAQSNMLREEMKQLNDTLTTVRTRREEIMARRNELLKVPAEDPGSLPDSQLLQSPLLQQLRQRYVDATRERDALIAGGIKGENHPEVLAATARVEASRVALLSEVRNVQGATQRDLAVVEQQEAGLSRLFEKAKAQALQLNLLGIEYNRLRRTKENNEKLYDFILQRTKESDLARMMRVNNVRVVDAPLLPRVPVRPRVPVDLGIGGALGLILGIVAATVRVLLDRTVKTPADVEQDLELPFLGLMPLIAPDPRRPGRKRHRHGPIHPDLIVHHSPRSGAAEAARTIRTNLMFTAPDHPYRTLLVTSAGPAEGKTTVASCIATAMAQAGQRVLLVDCDLRRPRIHRIFGRTLECGLTSALINDSALSEAVTHTDVDNLDVLPAGPVPPNPAEILQSERFRTLLTLLGERYDRIVLDSAPAAAVTDPAILARTVDGVVMVVRAYKTTKDLASHGLRSLLGVGGHVAGVVLNAVDLDRHEYKYYHYYYAKPGYTYGTAAAPDAPANPLQ